MIKNLNNYILKKFPALCRVLAQVLLISIVFTIHAVVYYRTSFILYCNDYTDPKAFNFSNPKSPSMLGILQLHDYIMFFITMILLLKIFFYIAAIWTSYRNVIYSRMPLDVKAFMDTMVILFHKYDYKEAFNRIIGGRSRQYFHKLLETRFHEEVASYVGTNTRAFRYLHILELIWTILPGVILVFMGIPSIYLLYSLEAASSITYTVMIVGNQWYWTYEYNDFDLHIIFSRLALENIWEDNFTDLREMERAWIAKTLNNVIMDDSFQFAKKKFTRFLSLDSSPISDGDLPRGYPRMLTVDQPLILPANCEIRLLITSMDVIHSWAVPAFGIKMDAIPGRINQVIFKTGFCGTSWGQCSEICGVNHSYMPIEVRVVEMADYDRLMSFMVKKYIEEHLNNYLMKYSPIYKKAFEQNYKIEEITLSR